MKVKAKGTDVIKIDQAMSKIHEHWQKDYDQQLDWR
jgi:hypothetical protein